MLRVLKSIGLGALVALTAAVAAPAATASAAGTPTVSILYNGSVQTKGWMAIPTGTSFSLDSVVSGSVKYDWVVTVDPKIGRVDTGITSKSIGLSCVGKGIMDVWLIVTDSANRQAADILGIYCQDLPKPEIDPKPRVQGQREVIPVGTTITFTSLNWKNANFDSEWRTTGVNGVAARGRQYTRKFDKPGNYGVEVTDFNEAGSGKMWVGYTVVAVPTASVKPAPSRGRLQVAQGDTITFDGSGSDGAGSSLQYQWRTTGVSGVAGKGVTFARKFDKAGDFGVELTVVNDLGQSSKQWVGVTVTKSVPPVVSVTPAPRDPNGRMKVKVGSVLTFDGRGSKDPDGGSLTYVWRTTGVSGVASTGSTYQRRFSKAGNYGVELVVTDDEGQTAKRWVGITVG